MQISLTMLSQTGGHGDDWFVSGVRACRCCRPIPGMPSAIVDGPGRDAAQGPRAAADGRQRGQGRDVRAACCQPATTRAHAHFSPAELDVLVAEATAAGMFVMAHAQAADGIKNAVRAGIRSIEHGIFLDDEGIDLMLAARHLARPDARGAAGRDRRRRGRASCFRRACSTRRRRSIDVHRRQRPARRSRPACRIAMGTDSGVTPARPEPARAGADGRARDGAGGRARGDDPQRRAAAGRRRRPRHDRARQGRPTSSSWAAIRSTSTPSPTGSRASGWAAGGSPEGAPGAARIGLLGHDPARPARCAREPEAGSGARTGPSRHGVRPVPT